MWWKVRSIAEGGLYCRLSLAKPSEFREECRLLGTRPFCRIGWCDGKMVVIVFRRRSSPQAFSPRLSPARILCGWLQEWIEDSCHHKSNPSQTCLVAWFHQ